jgi:Transglycosylase SLT domain/SPOR domain
MVLSRKRLKFCLFALACMVLGAAPIQADPSPPPDQLQPPAKAQFAKDVCDVIWQQSILYDLPAAFLARLIWKESLFDPNAVSPKGAQGIAQFMPGTAEANGLDDPFVPHQALEASARLLAKLRNDFGNLGLAAAAYNAGPDRVTSWLAGASALPFETQDYVSFITGKEAEDWSKREASFDIPAIGKDSDFDAACVKLASRQKNPPVQGLPRGEWKPWGVQIAGGFSSAAAMAQFKRQQQRFPDILGKHNPIVLRKANLSMGVRKLTIIRVGAESRDEAKALCSRLWAAGGACTVLKN